MAQNQYGFQTATSKSDAQIIQACDQVLLSKPSMTAPDRWRRKFTWVPNPPGEGVLRSYRLQSAGVILESIGQATVSVRGALIDVWTDGDGATRTVSVAGRAPHVNFNVNAGFMVFPKYMTALHRTLNA